MSIEDLPVLEEARYAYDPVHKSRIGNRYSVRTDLTGFFEYIGNVESRNVTTRGGNLRAEWYCYVRGAANTAEGPYRTREKAADELSKRWYR